MGDHIAKAQDFEKKAEKKLSGWGIFGSKYEDAADLFDKAANSFKLAKSCDFPLPPSLDSHPTQSRNSRESEQEMETRKRKPFSNITNIQNLTPLSVLRELVVSNGISKPATSILKPNSSSTNHELCPEASDPSNTSIGSCSVGATFNWKNVRFRHPPLAVSSHTSPTCSRIQSIENSKKERAAHAVVCTPIEKKDKVKAITLPFSSSSSEKTKDTQNKICKLDLTDGGVGIQKAVRFSSSKENHSDFRSETTKTSRKETESGVIACHSPIMKRKDKGKAIAVPYSSSPIQEQDTHNNVCNSSIQVEGQCKKDVENLGFSSGTVENVQGIHLYGHISGKADKGEANLNSSGRALEKILETGKDISDTSCRLLEKRTEKKKGILKHIISSSSQTNEMGKVYLNPSNSLAREAKDRGKSAATSNSLPEKTKGKRNVVLEPYNTGGSSSAVTVKSRSSRKTSEKNKNAVGVSSCPPMTRSKRMLRDIDEAGDLNCSKSWTAPQAKTRKRVCWKTKETSAWPEDFIREQKSYFDEVDNFELAVEEVSQDELE